MLENKMCILAIVCFLFITCKQPSDETKTKQLNDEIVAFAINVEKTLDLLIPTLYEMLAKIEEMESRIELLESQIESLSNSKMAEK